MHLILGLWKIKTVTMLQYTAQHFPEGTKKLYDTQKSK